MNVRFCLYCEPDKNGKHEKKCRLYKPQQKKQANKILDDYEDVLKTFADLSGIDWTDLKKPLKK